MSRNVKKELITIAVLFAVLIAVSFIPANGVLKLIIHLVPYFLAGIPVFNGMIKTFNKKNVLNGYVTMVLSSVIAIIVGRYVESAVVLLLFRLAKLSCDFTKNEALEGVDSFYKSDRKNTERAVYKISRIITQATVAIALVVMIIGLISGPSDWRNDIYRGTVLIAISYPAALVFTVPLAFGAGIGKALKNGIKIKSSYSVDMLSKCATVVFDKAGTLTDPSLTVNAAQPEVISGEQLLDIASLVLSDSHSPIALAIKNKSKGNMDKGLIANTEDVDGLGTVAYMSGKIVAVGTMELMNKLGIEAPNCQHDGETAVYISLGQTYLGNIVLADNIREDADRALYRLKAAGVKSIVMFSEDKMSDAARVADTLTAIDEFHHTLRPENKAKIIEEIFAESAENETLAFVADGVSNSQVLASADVSITLNGVDSDDTDVVIADASLEKIPLAINISDEVMVTVKTNIAVSLAVKLILSILGIVGVVSLTAAIFMDICVTILATLNALRPLIKK